MFYYVLITSVILAIVYFYCTKEFKYWKKRRVKYEEPKLFFGNIVSNVLAKQSMTQLVEEMYWKHPKENFVGYFHFSQPTLLLRDPDLIHQICTTDFHRFYARGFLDGQDNNKLEILMKNVFMVEGDMWRLLRIGLSPAFTSSMLKAMFPLVEASAERLRERTAVVCVDGRPVDAFDLMARYNIDFIGAFVLGIDGDSQKKENSAFRRLGERIFHSGINEIIVRVLKCFFPVTFKNLKYFGKVEKEFCDLVNEIIKRRINTISNRQDFIDLMLEIKAKGKIECESLEKKNPDGTTDRVTIEFDDALIAAQVFVFFSAGFETSSTATSYTLHEVAYNPEKQKKIQADIDRVLAKYNNKLSYEAIKEMHYLEWALKEGMRIFSPGGYLLRICRQKSLLHGTGVTVDEGIRVVIPVSALHHDPKYWDSPQEFRPERFSPEINEPKHKSAYLPFGAGPRACIGERMGLMQSMAGLAAILSRFTVSPSCTSVRRPAVNPKANLVQAVIGGLPLIFTPRTNRPLNNISCYILE